MWQIFKTTNTKISNKSERMSALVISTPANFDN